MPITSIITVNIPSGASSGISLPDAENGDDMKKTLIAVLSALAFISILSVMPAVRTQAAVKTMPDGGQFDPSFYAATYPDVYAVCGMNEALLYQHYLMFGIAEKRLPYAGAVAVQPAGTSGSATVITMPDGGLFDPVFYAKKYPDVAAVLGTNATVLYNHYLFFGITEGRLPYEGAPKPELKLSFTTVGAIAQVKTSEEVIAAVRQAAQFRVTQLTILATWNSQLSAEGITALVNAQSAYLNSAYRARVSTSAPKVYGSVDNLTIEVNVTLKFR